LATPREVDLTRINTRIIDGSTSQTNDQLYFVGTGKNYVKKSESGSYINVNKSGNFSYNTNPVGKKFSDILDGGDSTNSDKQFIAPIVGGVAPISDAVSPDDLKLINDNLLKITKTIK
jgi:hypothetical protein